MQNMYIDSKPIYLGVIDEFLKNNLMANSLRLGCFNPADYHTGSSSASGTIMTYASLVFPVFEDLSNWAMAKAWHERVL
jgi:hypothetical protein